MSRLSAPPTKPFLQNDGQELDVLIDAESRESVVKHGEHAKSWRPPLKWKSGFKILAIYIVGSVVLLLVIAYLSFLWLGKADNGLWPLIVAKNWVATSTAISAVLIRTTVTMQTAVTVAMVALYNLRTGTTLYHVPGVSSLRYSKSGPLTLLRLSLSSTKTCFNSLSIVIVILSTISTMLLQFSSTMLVSDLATAHVSTSTNMTTTGVLTSDEDIDRNNVYQHFYTDALMTSEPAYPLFAEYSQRLTSTMWPINSSIDDSGPSIRALLPLSANEDRSRLRSFEGNASLYDARWICTQPNLTDFSLVGSSENLAFTGNIKQVALVPPMVTWNGSRSFNCTLLLSDSATSTDSWPIFTCPIDPYNNNEGLLNSLDLVYDTSQVQVVLKDSNTWSEFALPFSGSRDMDDGFWEFNKVIGRRYLVINMTDVAATDYAPSEISLNDSSARKTTLWGPWTRIKTFQGGLEADSSKYSSQGSGWQGWNMTMDVSICASAFANLRSMNISAYQSNAVGEPASVEDGVKQIAASQSPGSIHDRGIMQLDKAGLQKQLQIERDQILANNLTAPINPLTTVLNFLGFHSHNDIVDTGRIWYPSLFLMTDTLRSVHESRAALFQRVIQDTGSPALAMQSMQHTVITDRYYKYLPYSFNRTTSRTTFFEPAIQPVRKTGFVIVMAALAIHLCLTAFTAITLGLFQGWSQTITAIDQVWQSHAQVSTLQNEVKELLDGADLTRLGDNEINRELKRVEQNDQVYVLINGEDGQLRFRKRDHEQ